NQAKSKFIEMTEGYPVTIEYLAGILWRIPGFDGIVTLESLKKSTYIGLKMNAEYYKISQRDIHAHLKARGKSISLGQINQVMQGQKENEDVNSALLDLIEKKKGELGDMPLSTKAA
ncbi:MAG: hypothetical protein K8R21_10440, partial [Leptospira sp.]|nr:hypothetical protein [Leptospira sp.]